MKGDDKSSASTFVLYFSMNANAGVFLVDESQPPPVTLVAGCSGHGVECRSGCEEALLWFAKSMRPRYLATTNKRLGKI